MILISLGTDSEEQEKQILLMCMKYLRSINKRCWEQWLVFLPHPQIWRSTLWLWAKSSWFVSVCLLGHRIAIFHPEIFTNNTFFSTGISSRQHQKALESFTVTFFVQTECSKEERSRASGNRRWEFGATTENRSDRQPGYERGHLNSWLSPLLLCRRFLFCLKVCKFRPLPPSLTHPLCSPNHFWLHRSQCIYFFSVFFFLFMP